VLSGSFSLSAQSAADQAVQLLTEALKCPLPPTEASEDNGAKDRTMSEMRYTGTAQRLAGYRLDTVRTFNKQTGRVQVRTDRVDILANYIDIDRVSTMDGMVILQCEYDRPCFHVIFASDGDTRDGPAVVQQLCDETTAENAAAAIKALIVASGGHFQKGK
jgi:hypothetical protein